jgi:hypothetical protein
MTSIQPNTCHHTSHSQNNGVHSTNGSNNSNVINDVFESVDSHVHKVEGTDVGTSFEIDLSGFFGKLSKKLRQWGPLGRFIGNLGTNWAKTMRGFGKLFRGDIGGGLKDIVGGAFIGPIKNAFNLTGLGWMSFLSKKVKVQ